ncbi:hypothetical protein PR003_g15631 [Phytophthora rubi]|uniref:Uncharacterized protein n=1 Tax=Phytophthora rubi TaxID=129364 RepID=A0A6A3JCT8_9STRA|nr:hypothetical protein PR001_g23966 [Phytophthora rubi]KAE8989964.1 hypothetical protein PR002_g21287 [Phytophthora rubi]KAE9329092.1 hypothetical protein PR003_g15631 [Phytophthora rubi]
MGLIPADARMSTLPGSNDNVTMDAEQCDTSGQGSAKRRRRLTTAERILEIVEKDREDDLAERKEEREREEDTKPCDLVIRLSAAVQAATVTLNGLKEHNAGDDQIEAAQVMLDKMISRWTRAMERASEQ